ncbi:phage tail spike protein [Streptococcus suis]
MLLTIHDMNLRQVASIDNDKQDALNYINDKWHRYLETGSSTFEFTVFKRTLKKDTGSKHAYHYLNNKAFVSFEYEGEVQLFKVRKIVENEKTITCSCVNLNLELINEYANPFKSEQSKTFKEYCEAMDLLNFTLLTIGVNEISDKRIKAEWTGQDTKLARLLSLANKFGAELEFKTYLNDDSSIKSFVVNIYHENDDTHHGVGRIHAKPLRYGKDFKSLIRTVDNTNIYNAVRPTGKAENGDIVTIGGMEAWSVNNEYGEREFYQQGELLYAPLSMQMFPSAFTSSTMADQWIRKDITVDSADKKVIRATAYRELKKHAYPDVSYEVEGFIDRGLGDTVFVYDDGFVPTLLLRMRVVEQEISFTNPSSNRTRFANFKTLDNLLPDDLQKRIDELFEASQPYLIKLATDNGVIFKNGTGQSIVTPTLYKGGKPLTANVTWRWSLDGAVKTGMTYTARGADVTDTSTLTIAAYIGNDEVAVDELTFVNVLDGRDGAKGEKGDPGQRGADGLPGRDGVGVRSTTVTYASSTNGTTAPTTDWTVAVPTVAPGNYLWTKTVWTYTDGNTETGYNVSRIGRDGNTGRDGIAGKDGVGIRSTTITYGKSTSGTIQPTSWTSQVPSVPNGQFLWTKTVWAYTDNTTETGYSVAKMGETGPKGADGRTPYIHWAYSDSADGTGLTTSDNGQRYIGHYSDYTQADSTDKTKYRWADRWAKIEVGGRNILRNATFSNPKERSEAFTVGGITYKNIEIPSWGSMYNSGISNPTTSYHAFYRESFNGTGPVIEFNESNGQRNWKGLNQTLQASDLRVGKYTFSADIFATGIGTKIQFGIYYYNKAGQRDFHSGKTTINISTTNKWHRVSGNLKLNDDIDFTKEIMFFIYAFEFTTNSILYLTKPQLEEGTVATTFGEAQADVEKRIDAKADQILTQEQLNSLNERAGIIRAELEAKASLDTVNNILKQIKDMKAADEATWAKVEKDLITHLQRVIKIETNLGDQAQRWNAVDTFMQVSNDGLSLGKADGSSSMLFSPDGRITMFSSGTPVMYVDKGVIHIDNGIFSKTVQIGRFREEQYHNNPDINVKRYVGG